jgi:hypothetical protein
MNSERHVFKPWYEKMIALDILCALSYLRSVTKRDDYPMALNNTSVAQQQIRTLWQPQKLQHRTPWRLPQVQWYHSQKAWHLDHLVEQWSFHPPNLPPELFTN